MMLSFSMSLSNLLLGLLLVSKSASATCGINAPCEVEGSTCAFGTETCCGETYDSLLCECAQGGGGLEYMCMPSDACMAPNCGTDGNEQIAYTPDPEVTVTDLEASPVCDSNAPCEVEGSTCASGTETCCGETYDSLKCECAQGDGGGLEYRCFFSDACMMPNNCETDGNEQIAFTQDPAPELTDPNEIIDSTLVETVDVTDPNKVIDSTAPVKVVNATDPTSSDTNGGDDETATLGSAGSLLSSGIMKPSISIIASTIAWSLLG